MVKQEGLEKLNEFTTHKERSQWFRERIAYPLRDAHPGLLENYWGRMAGAKRPAYPWKCAGPFNVAGRVTSLAVDPRDSQRIYAGAATGGVWKSLDGGRTWSTKWPRWINSNVGALAIDPFDPTIIYCGTGESNMSADTYPGSGIYCSKDRGNRWDLLAPAGQCAIPRRVAVLAVHPYIKSGEVIYLGGISHDPTMPAGLYVSRDRGVFWEREAFFSDRNYQCQALAFHPEGLIFAAVNLRGSRSGIWRQSETGWKQLRGGLPAPDRFGRVSLAIAPSRPDTIYALITDSRGQAALGVYCSRNKGDDWVQIDKGALAGQIQMSYNNTIAVHPECEDTVICGGNDLFMTRDAGVHWRRASRWDASLRSSLYAHADHHALAMPGGDLIYSGNDGGVAASEDLGLTWQRRDRGMATTMFYDVTVARSNSKVFGGGTQDNGTLLAGVTGPEGYFLEALRGDGAWMVIDASNEFHVFGSTQNVSISRHVEPGRWGRRFWLPASPE